MMKRLVIFAAIALLATGAYASVKQDLDDGQGQHDQCFQVPPAVPTSIVHVEDFEGGIPGTWTVIDNGTLNSG